MALRLNYSPTKMKQALESVRSGALSRRKAAAMYGVPKTTLLDKLSGRTPEERVRPGPATVLTDAEEIVLCDYIKIMASIGYPVSREELLIEVKRILDLDGRANPFKNNKPGKDWFYAFQRRHPDLSERSAMALGHHRAVVNMAMIQGWFDGLTDYLKAEVADHENLLKDPRRLFNCDESGFPLCLKTGKVLAARGARHVYHVSSSNKQQITVMVCFNAFGQYVPPLIVYPGQRFRDTGIEGFPSAIYGHTINGWMDSDLFVSFLEQFLAYVDTQNIPKPVLLFVDGHSTHMSRAAATFCARNGIILYCLLPNATHVLQPCDVGFFSPMKAAWKKNLKQWQLENIGEALTKRQFPAVFKNAWQTVSTLENAVHGFKRSGLWPLDPNGIDKTKLEPSRIANPPSNQHENVPIEQNVAQGINAHANVSRASICTSNASTAAGVTSAVTLAIPGPSCDTTSAVEVKPSFATQALPGPSCNTPSAVEMKTTTSADSQALPGPSCDTTSVAEMKQTTSDAKQALPGPSGDRVLISYLTSGNRTSPAHHESLSVTAPTQPRQSSVSSSFQYLSVPLPKKRRQPTTFFAKLPKALSGSAALKMFEEREEQKKADELSKQRRQEEREKKKKEKQEMQDRKKREREEKKRNKEEEKRLKQMLKDLSKRRRTESSSSDSATDVHYADSDEACNELEVCPGCHTDDVYNDDDEWVKCVKCSRRWHVTCAGDPVLSDIPVQQLKEYPFHCEYCV